MRRFRAVVCRPSWNVSTSVQPELRRLVCGQVPFRKAAPARAWQTLSRSSVWRILSDSLLQSCCTGSEPRGNKRLSPLMHRCLKSRRSGELSLSRMSVCCCLCSTAYAAHHPRCPVQSRDKLFYGFISMPGCSRIFSPIYHKR